MGGRLFVQGDTSLNGNLLVKGYLIVQQGQSNQNIINTTTTNYQLIVSEDISLNGRLFVSGDVSMGGRLLVQGFTTHIGDASFNSRVIIGSDLSLGGRLFLPNNSVADSALSTNIVTLAGSQTLTNKTLTTPIISTITNGSATITLPTTTNTLATLTGTETLTNKTITTTGLLTVGSGLVMTAGDASFNNRVLVGSDISMGGRLYVQGSAIFQTAPTMSGANIATGTIPITSVAGTAVDIITTQTIGGTKTFSNQITTNGGIVSLTDVSLGGNTFISKNLGVGTTTPQFTIDAQGGGVGCGRVIQFGSTGGSFVTTGGSPSTFNGGTVANDISLNARLFVNGNTYLALGSGTNYVGIGQPTPVYTLDTSGTIRAMASSNQFIITPPSSATNLISTIRFNGTFYNLSSDTGVRNSAQINSGFSSKSTAWGGEYLSFNVGNNGNSNDGAGANCIERMRIDSNGNVGIGTSNPQYALDINGSARGTAFTPTSDYRIKENPAPLDGTFTVDSLKPMFYFNTALQKNDIGLLAHELQEHYPYLVNGEKDGEHLQSVNYNGLIGLLIKEIQDAKQQIKDMKTQLDGLSNK
jgi:hypothetical protein